MTGEIRAARQNARSDVLSPVGATQLPREETHRAKLRRKLLEAPRQPGTEGVKTPPDLLLASLASPQVNRPVISF